MSELKPDDFATFFMDVHGYPPFPWQKRLAAQVARDRVWPDMLDLPTGSGKTAAIDVAVFHLALEADRAAERRAPVRIAFVVDRRIVVDDASARAERIAKSLATASTGSIAAVVADRLRDLAGGRCPLVARALRGGLPREDDWAHTPAQPTVLCSTVDQVGSRLLFRGYGVSDRMKPVHAGLLGSDCLILLDEAHLAEPFRQTLEWVTRYRGDRWRESTEAVGPWGVSLLTATATPGVVASTTPFGLHDDDQRNETLDRRLRAPKSVRLVGPSKSTTADDEPLPHEDAASQRRHAGALVDETLSALAAMRAEGVTPAIGVVVNRVALARDIFQRLRREFSEVDVDVVLMIGPSRPVDRDSLVVAALDAIRTDTRNPPHPRALPKPFILVATQCIEAGVDIDLDALITDAAPLDALQQRFGRLNRAGRDVPARGAVVAARRTLESRYDDPVYGKAIKAAWDYLATHARRAEKQDTAEIDFGINAFRALQKDDPPPEEARSRLEPAPILMPAHLDLLSHTSPIPVADPDVALYLHGPRRETDSISVVWRADVSPLSRTEDPVVYDVYDDRTRRLLLLMPPRAREAIQLPLWAVRDWLRGVRRVSSDLADVAAVEQHSQPATGEGTARQVFRWRGDDERSRWVWPLEITPGDTIVVPARYGGLDRYGWNPHVAAIEDADDAHRWIDVADKAGEPLRGRRFAVRVAPGLLAQPAADALPDALAAAPTRHWQSLRDAVLELALPDEMRKALTELDSANRRRERREQRTRAVIAHDDLYGYDGGRPRGVVFVALFGLEQGAKGEDQAATTEDDAAGSMPGFALPLEAHCTDVEWKAEEFARRLGLPADRVRDLRTAGYLHDAGKIDPRFQGWLHYGDPLGADPDEPQLLLAKSEQSLPGRARKASGLPEKWRHEALSVRLVTGTERFGEASDPELVLWLIGTHHGYGRPFFPHADPDDGRPRRVSCVLGLPGELAPGAGPQSLAFEWNGLDWAGLFARLKARYGLWELARMEAILRLADHRASDEAARRVAADAP